MEARVSVQKILTHKVIFTEFFVPIVVLCLILLRVPNLVLNQFPDLRYGQITVIVDVVSTLFAFWIVFVIVRRYLSLLHSSAHALKQQSETYKNVLEQIYDGFFEIDANETLTYCNRSLSEIVGIPKKEMLGTNYKDYVPADVVASMAQAFEHVLKSGEPVTGFTWGHITPSGKTRFLEMAATRITNDAGTPLGIRGIIRNVTRKRQTEMALEVSEQRYRSLVEYNDEAIFALDVRGRLKSANPAGNMLLGQDRALVGLRFADLIAPEDMRTCLEGFEKVLQGDVVEEEVKVVHGNGNIVHVRAKGIPIVVNGQIKGVYAILHDITERKQAEELMMRSEKLTIVGQMAAGVAHEIRNPLASLKGFVQLLQRTQQPKPEYLQIMLSELGRIETIVKEFLFVAKPHDLKFALKDPRRIVDDVVTLLRTQAILKNIEIVTDYHPAPSVSCDESRLKQVFVNIIKNAIEAMTDGGHIYVRVDCDGDDHVRFRVEDEGPGIPKHRLARIGEPFYTTKDTGTGLGLMVTQKIVEAHQGRLIIESALGKGTSVDVLLPGK